MGLGAMEGREERSICEMVQGSLEVATGKKKDIKEGF
jgi:hypothetical protein